MAPSSTQPAIRTLASLPRARYRQAGDGARHGAVQLLVAREQRLAARSLARKVRYIELTTHRAFTEMFMLLMQL
jgi:uncharacterized 2Fe-2S/4Fe-4S cluster protein (DUF4445 family)